jgi:hypothetical protein
VSAVKAVEEARERVVLPLTFKVDENTPVVPVIAPRLASVE